MYELRAGRSHHRNTVGVDAVEGKETQQAGPDISLLRPALQKQWDHAANAHLGNIVIRPQSNKKVHWKCNACPDGHLHQWTASVASRSNGRGCPQCSGRKVCKHNCLTIVAPWAAAQWDFEANAALGTPGTVVAHSNQPFGWRCQVCGHRWTVSPDKRVSQRTGCPKCAPRGPVTRHPTFAECQHPLLQQWDHTHNDARGNYPNNTKLRSSKQIIWVCSKCPAGQEHSWSATPKCRTSSKQSGCPICAGQVACRCNSLQALFPAIAAQWDYGENQGQPSHYTAHSHHVAWWHSPERGSWRQTIHSRTQGRSNRSERKLIQQQQALEQQAVQ